MNQPISTTLANGVVITAPQHLVAQALIGLAGGQQYSVLSTTLSTSAIPRPGTLWPEQGGINLGLVTGENGGPDYYLIQPLDPRAYLKGELGTYTVDVKGACHKRDGWANTRALAAAGSDLCKQILVLEIDGFTDLYLPSQLEQNLQYHYGGDSFVKEWHWSSTQYSAYYAFGQDFSDGIQDGLDKDGVARARAVRRFVIQ